MRAASMTDVGRARERNEDAAFVGKAVFAVADGLGGHNAGEVASNLALGPVASLDEMEPRKASHHVADAVRKSNRAVFDRAQQDAELKGMGTTMTAVVVSEGIAHIAHVGDSRCYLVRGGQIEQLSHDHTLVARMVSEGKLTAEQAEVHPQRSILTRALGADRDVDVEEVNVPLATGDRLVLCSDGLSGVLAPDDIRAVVTDGADLEEICRALIDAANARGGPDNITAVVVDVGTVQGSSAGPLGRRNEPGHRRRVPVRPLVWAALLATVLIGGYMGVQSWADNSFFVGVDEAGRVAIYRGLPVDVPVMDLNDVEESTDIVAEEVRNPAVRRSLEEGIRADSLTHAQEIIDEQVAPYLPEPEPRPEPTHAKKKGDG